MDKPLNYCLKQPLYFLFDCELSSDFLYPLCLPRVATMISTAGCGSLEVQCFIMG